MDRYEELKNVLEEADIGDIANLIRTKIGCEKCPAKKLCDECLHESYDGDCESVLGSWLSYEEEEDTKAQRERERTEAEAEDRASYEGWRYR